MATLSVGSIVQYTLSKEDVEQISRRRKHWPLPQVRRVTTKAKVAQAKGAQAPIGTTKAKVAQPTVGNPVKIGDVVPAIVIRHHDDEASTFDGQAFLNGNDMLWITSVPYSPYSTDSKPGTWHGLEM